MSSGAIPELRKLRTRTLSETDPSTALLSGENALQTVADTVLTGFDKFVEIPEFK